MYYTSDAQIVLFHAASGRYFTEIKNLEYSIPFEGDQADDSITFETLPILTNQLVKNFDPLEMEVDFIGDTESTAGDRRAFPSKSAPNWRNSPAYPSRSECSKSNSLDYPLLFSPLNLILPVRGNGILLPSCRPTTRFRYLERRVDHTIT